MSRDEVLKKKCFSYVNTNDGNNILSAIITIHYAITEP